VGRTVPEQPPGNNVKPFRFGRDLNWPQVGPALVAGQAGGYVDFNPPIELWHCNATYEMGSRVWAQRNDGRTLPPTGETA